MSSVQRMLFPVDFSNRCEATAPHIVDLAKRFRAKLDVLHVIETNQNAQNLWRKREMDLEAFAARIPGGTYLSRTVVHGQPAQAIIRYAKIHGTDIIAMPTRGNGILRRWLLGSITENVLRQASCAVWTESGMGYPDKRWSPILCAVDLENGSEEVVSYAWGLAQMFHTNLVVIHAIPPMTEGALWHPSHLPAVLSHKEAECKLEELLHGLNISAEFVAETGSVEDIVRATAERTRAQLIAIGRGGYEQANGSLGAHTYELVSSAPCPVVSVPQRRLTTSCFWTEWQEEDSARETEPSLYPVAGPAR